VEKNYPPKRLENNYHINQKLNSPFLQYRCRFERFRIRDNTFLASRYFEFLKLLYKHNLHASATTTARLNIAVILHTNGFTYVKRRTEEALMVQIYFQNTFSDVLHATFIVMYIYCSYRCFSSVIFTPICLRRI
jgi:hypothetical protein